MKSFLLPHFKILLLAFIISFPLIIPYFKPGYFPTDDGEWAVIRLSEMYREIKSFEIPARYSTYLNFQYGYPLFNYTYPMPYYMGMVPVLLKFGFVNSIKLLFAISVVLSFFSMFILSKSLWKNNFAAFVGAFLYIYVPYRIVDLYVRGSLGESLSFVLFPLVLLSIKNIYENKEVKNMLMFSVFFALLITTHNIMAVLLGILIIFIIIASILVKNFSFILRLFISIFYALCLSAFFWLPALAEKNLILLSKIPIADRNLYFVNFWQLITPKWGYGAPIFPDGFSYQIGVPQITIFIVAGVLSFFKSVKTKTEDAKIAFFLFVSTALVILLMFPLSSFIWSHTSLLSEINYPWTFLAIVMLLTSLLAGYLTKQAKFFIPLLLLCALSFILVFPYAKPKSYVNRGDAFYLTNQGTTTSSNELMPLWVKTQPIQQADQRIENLNGHEVINLISVRSNKINFNTFLTDKRTVQINTIYFPGWEVFINGFKSEIDYDNQHGLMRVKLNKGKNNVEVKFGETSLRLTSDIISIASLIGFVVLYALNKNKKFKKIRIWSF